VSDFVAGGSFLPAALRSVIVRTTTDVEVLVLSVGGDWRSAALSCVYRATDALGAQA
jgi:hypothetical protein